MSDQFIKMVNPEEWPKSPKQAEYVVELDVSKNESLPYDAKGEWNSGQLLLYVNDREQAKHFVQTMKQFIDQLDTQLKAEEWVEKLSPHWRKDIKSYHHKGHFSHKQQKDQI